MQFLFIKIDGELNLAHRPEFANLDLDNRTVCFLPVCEQRPASPRLTGKDPGSFPSRGAGPACLKVLKQPTSKEMPELSMSKIIL